MKTLVLTFLFIFSAQILFAQVDETQFKRSKINGNYINSNPKTWRPTGFSKLSENEQAIINSLTPINQKNKSFVQLLLDAGSYGSCGVGTALRQDKLFVSIVDSKTSTRYSYLLNFKKALVNEHAFIDRKDSGSLIHILVFDQTVKNVSGELETETVFIYFNFNLHGSIKSMLVSTKKKSGYDYPVISLVTGNVEPQYEFYCNSK